MLQSISSKIFYTEFYHYIGILGSARISGRSNIMVAVDQCKIALMLPILAYRYHYCTRIN